MRNQEWEETSQQPRRLDRKEQSGGGGLIVVLFLIGALLFAATIYFKPSFFAGVGLILIGVFVWAFAAFVTMQKKYFIIAEANEVIIRTGRWSKQTQPKSEEGVLLGAAKIVRGSGIWCIPLFHRYRILQLRQVDFQIVKTEKGALLCQDGLLADVRATMKVAVDDTDLGILRFIKAAGDRDWNDPRTIEVLTRPGCETALRDACTQNDYLEVYKGRELVGDKIEKSVASDFKLSGVILIAAKLEDVDATKSDFYDARNPQHALGLTKITNIIEDQRLLTETKKLATAEAVRQKSVENEKAILLLNQQAEFAKAAQAREVKVKQTEELKASEQAQIASEQAVQERRVEKDKAIAIAQQEQQKATQIAEQERLIVLAAKQAEQAKAEQLRLAAEKEKVQAAEAVMTAQQTEAANRTGQVALIAAQKKAEEELVKAQKSADAEAYKITADAKARKDAAENGAEAVRVQAEAAKDAALAQAEGAKANAMIPVEVDKERVAVLAKDLSTRQEFAEAGIKLELQKLEVTKRAEVQIAYANTMATMMSSAEMKIIGDPATLMKTWAGMSTAFGINALADGLVDGMPAEAKQFVGASLDKISAIVSGAAKNLFGKTIDADTVKAMIQAQLEEQK